MSETPNLNPKDERAQAAAIEVIIQLYGLCRAAPLYDPNNTTIRRLVESLTQTVTHHLGEHGERLAIQLLADEFFVNGRLLRMDFATWERATSLANTLSRYQLTEIVFEPNVDSGNIELFTTDLCRSVRQGQSSILPEGYGGLRSRRGTGTSQATLRLEPHQLALFLYGGLLDLSEALHSWTDEKKTPSLLPIRRSLQLVIDAQDKLSGAFQVLTLLHSPGKRISKAWTRVNIALHAIGFARYLGLERVDILQLGLAGVLGGLSESEQPEEAIQPLFRFPGIGEAALPLLLAVHDSRAARVGEPSGTAGHILAVAERYEALVQGSADRPGVSPYQAMRTLSTEQTRGPDTRIMRMFVIWKSFFPLGSLVQLSDGRVGIVIAQPDEQKGKQRPTVMALRYGTRAGETISLKERPDLNITGAPDPKELGLDLSAVLSAATSALL